MSTNNLQYLLYHKSYLTATVLPVQNQPLMSNMRQKFNRELFFSQIMPDLLIVLVVTLQSRCPSLKHAVQLYSQQNINKTNLLSIILMRHHKFFIFQLQSSEISLKTIQLLYEILFGTEKKYNFVKRIQNFATSLLVLKEEVVC